jgi:hypothetical protein
VRRQWLTRRKQSACNMWAMTNAEALLFIAVVAALIALAM